MTKPTRSPEFLREMDGDFEQSDLRHWRRRLIHRKYSEWGRPSHRGEYSVRISHEGASWYFPLGTDDSNQAAAEALRIYRVVIDKGWAEACGQFPREFTLGIFWNTNPAAATYTTLCTSPGVSARQPARKNVSGRIKVGIIEPDPNVAEALAEWANRCEDSVCAKQWTTGSEAARELKDCDVDLLLFNRHLPDLTHGQMLDSAAKVRPTLAAFGYGIYETSDDIFISLTGVDGGYFFRRRPPAAILEPVTPAWSGGPPSLEQVHARVQNYFQSLLILPHNNEKTPDVAALTHREQEILHCLRRGLHDKEIARVLDISAWTVHTHLKNIFEKLKVHTRTEAVIKYLQK